MTMELQDAEKCRSIIMVDTIESECGKRGDGQCCFGLGAYGTRLTGFVDRLSSSDFLDGKGRLLVRDGAEPRITVSMVIR